MKVNPAMKAVIEGIKENKKTPSLTNVDMSRFFNGDKHGSPFYSTFTKDEL